MTFNKLYAAGVLVWLLCLAQLAPAQNLKQDSAYLRTNYIKLERMIPMRDGVKLFTAIYVPKDESASYPFLITRTPYSCAPYGENNYPRRVVSNTTLLYEKYIFVKQDVRGRYMSEGNFEEVTPHIADKKSKKDVDESSDTFDTIEWLLKNIKNNNGRAGIFGISYPGFYATASLPGAHPALKAVSPQAPVTDEFQGDDAYHNGAFFLMDNMSFMNYFDHPRSSPWKQYPPITSIEMNNTYPFFKELGPIKQVNDKYLKHKSKIWDEYLAHPTYDSYWQNRNIRQHLKDIKPAVLVVGGWFDAEDLFGALRTYEAIEKQTTSNNNRLVMGPWTHGAWAGRDWSSYVSYTFGANTTEFYKVMESSFFNFYLKDKGKFNVPEATVFETGSNQWRTYDAWPPAKAVKKKLYMQEGKLLSFTEPTKRSSFDEYVSDPANPVPYTAAVLDDRDPSYMAADQRFVANRPDVRVYQTGVLDADVVVSGPIGVNLFFSTTGTDADFVVKLIDVMPNGDTATIQQLVRGDVFRGKFRNSFEKPEAFVAGQVTPVKFQLNDIAHAFKKGHRIMVQVQHSWFPLVDINPQKFINIPDAEPTDFQKATHRLYHDASHASYIELGVME